MSDSLLLLGGTDVTLAFASDGLLRIVEASNEDGVHQLDNLFRSAHKRFDS